MNGLQEVRDEIAQMSDSQLQFLESGVKKDLRAAISEAQKDQKNLRLEIRKAVLRIDRESHLITDEELKDMLANVARLMQEQAKVEALIEALPRRAELYRSISRPESIPVEIIRR